MEGEDGFGSKRHAVGRFSNRIDAERALSELNHAGFLAAQISIVAKYTDHNHRLDRADSSCRAEGEAQTKASVGEITGGMLGAVVGCLVGLGMLPVPGVVVILAVKTAGTAIATTLAGAGIGATGGGLISVLAGLKISPNRVRVNPGLYSQGGEYLLVVDGTDDEVHRAQSILSRSCSSKVWVC